MHRDTIGVVDAGTNLAAYVLDSPGCVATATTPTELARLIQGVIELHIAGLAENRLPIPLPSRHFASIHL